MKLGLPWCNETQVHVKLYGKRVFTIDHSQYDSETVGGQNQSRVEGNQRLPLLQPKIRSQKEKVYAIHNCRQGKFREDRSLL